MIEKISKKADKWVQTALREGVKDYEKNFEMVRGFGVEMMGFDAQGQSYKRVYDNAFLSSNFSYSVQPYFVVDKTGECLIAFKLYVGPQKMATGKLTQTTVNVNTGGLLNTQKQVGKTTSQEYVSFDVGSLSVIVRAADLDQFKQHLGELLKELDAHDNSERAKDKLFK